LPLLVAVVDCGNRRRRLATSTPTQRRPGLSCSGAEDSGAVAQAYSAGFWRHWCGDCQVLEIYMHNADNRSILEANYVVVHVKLGVTTPTWIWRQYGIPLQRAYRQSQS